MSPELTNTQIRHLSSDMVNHICSILNRISHAQKGELENLETIYENCVFEFLPNGCLELYETFSTDFDVYLTREDLLEDFREYLYSFPNFHMGIRAYKESLVLLVVNHILNNFLSIWMIENEV